MTETTSWQPGRRFVLRVAALPLESIRGLRCPDTAHWAEAVLSAERDLRDRGQNLSDLLHRLVPAAGRAGTAGECRRALLGLRRDIFNNRLPARPEYALDLLVSLDPETAQHTRRWLDDRRDLSSLEEQGQALLESEVVGTREALRALLGDERLRAGLLLASPTLDSHLESYLRLASDIAPDKRMRKVERSALSYVYRTACKTSPFSTFTGVALGTFGDGDDPAVHVRSAWRGRVRLNVVALARFAEQITASAERRADLPVRLASGWAGDEGRVRYVRRWVSAGDDTATVTFDTIKDRLFFLRRSGSLDRLIGYLSERSEVRYQELVDRLSTDHKLPDRELCDTYVSALLDLGMIRVPCLDIDVHSSDPLRSFIGALTALRRPWADDLARRLDRAAALIGEYAGANRVRRAEVLRRLRVMLEQALARLGAQKTSLPQTLLYEDTDAGRDIQCALGAWTGPQGGALRAVERVLPAFDLTLPQRLTFKGFFLARYGRGGRCEDLLGLVHDFHEDFFDQYLSFTSKRTAFDSRGEYVPEENWLGLEEVKALDRARLAFIARMRARWQEHSDDSDIELTDTDLAEVADGLERLRAPFLPQSHHLQLASQDDQPLVVLNRSYGGLSFPFSRFTHLWDEVPGSTGPGNEPASEERLARVLREQSLRLTPPGTVLAELTGGPVTSNLNLHSRLTEYQIVCPGEVSTVPEDRRIPFEDLSLEHCKSEDRLILRSHRLGHEVIPVYLGYLVPLALPEIPRTLLLLSPTSMAPLQVWPGVPAGPAHQGVTRRPRVRHRNVVLSRRSWSTTAASLPLRPTGAPTAGGFLAWQRWRREHRVPERVFVTVSGGSRGGAGAKPQYVDFHSHLSLTAFEALIKTPEDRVVLREMLPAESDLHVASEQGGHVAELSVETFTSTVRRPTEKA
ncbi:lantibiotic biosynthesis dehydratase-like protein [Streptomyces sp. T12]|uniref:lantibiotic dehydratase n=1 Tax=Streptomyces sp. T12 TaxID=477697 RepID=UPI0011A4B237|nr:lantibiotic dehydratase [Streptomyces sp. T12]TWD17659.1 lantibiotic biosynthesis dehydratase-like protein [Streptomyces sp. T12]